jgi:DHA1 family bicyclomycin/chloramphenicol resistance-like MFS transporter
MPGLQKASSNDSGLGDKPAIPSTVRSVSLAVLLVAIGPISLGVAAPALPALVAVFKTSPSEVKLTLTAFLVGLASAQLVCGPLSDAYGRRSVAIAFMAVYSMASLALALAPTLEWMLVARFLQGTGAAAGWSMARAVVRDLHAGRSAGRVLSLVGVGQGTIPALAPAIGGVLLLFSTWAGTFLFMLAYGLISMAVLLVWLPETRRGTERMNPREWIRSYAMLIREPRLIGPSLVLGLSISCNYSMLIIIPFVLIDMVGLTPVEYGNAMLISVGAYVFGSAFCGRLFRRLEAEAVILIGLGTQLSGALLIFILVNLAGPSIATVILPYQLMLVGATIVMPSAGTAALTPFSTGVGAASGLLTFFQVTAGLGASLVAAALSDPLLALFSLTLCPPVLALGVYILFKRVAGRAGPAGRRRSGV